MPIQEIDYEKMIDDLSLLSAQINKIIKNYPNEWHLNKVHLLQLIKHDMDFTKIDQEEENLLVLAAMKKFKDQKKNNS